MTWQEIREVGEQRVELPFTFDVDINLSGKALEEGEGRRMAVSAIDASVAEFCVIVAQLFIDALDRIARYGPFAKPFDEPSLPWLPEDQRGGSQRVELRVGAISSCV